MSSQINKQKVLAFWEALDQAERCPRIAAADLHDANKGRDRMDVVVRLEELEDDIILVVRVVKGEILLN